jgi:hypothetical protein
MKSKIVRAEKEESYPCLKECTRCLGLVVLFTGLTRDGFASGTVVSAADSCYDLGHCCDNWAQELFEKFEGVVVLAQV